MIGLLLLALSLTSPGNCPPPPLGPQGDQASAEVYLEVARRERAAGAREAAMAAYRKALGRDPSHAAARAELAELCAGGLPQAAMTEAAQLMSRGDLRGAIAVLEKLRRAGPDARAALLEGICYYRLGEDQKASPLLEEASRDPRHADSAQLYLGLIAHRAGEARTAAEMFGSVAGSLDPRLQAQADLLHRAASRAGRVTLRLAIGSGYDTTRDLQPDGAPGRALAGAPQPSTADGALATSGVLGLAPFGPVGPYARFSGIYRKQVNNLSPDYGGLEGAAGYQLGRFGRRLAAEYAYEYAAFGGTRFLVAHRLLGTGRWPLGAFALGATYALRFQTYYTSTGDTSVFTGTRHRADVWGSWAKAGNLLSAGYLVVRTLAVGPNSYLEHGPAASFRWGVTPRARVTFRADYLRRTYQADLNGSRSDAYLDGFVTGELDLGDHWTLRSDLSLQKPVSNVALAFDLRVTAWLGMSYAVGLF